MKISYKEALKLLSNYEEYISLTKNLNAFDVSLILALLFDKNKEDTLNDIIKIQRRLISRNVKEVRE